MDMQDDDTVPGVMGQLAGHLGCGSHVLCRVAFYGIHGQQNRLRDGFLPQGVLMSQLR